jgi:hypothetical protein
MKQITIIEIMPDGRAALRIAIVPDDEAAHHSDIPVPHQPVSDRGVWEYPMYEEEPKDDHVGSVIWKM